MIEEPRNLGKNSISPDTLAHFLTNNHKQYLIVDCRFDYEYQGGHIKGALNINDPQQMKDFFLKDKQQIEYLMNTVIIFHCEFSQKRGPEMYAALREIDRRLNMQWYPQLFYSEIYILEGGYSQFHSLHPQFCNGGYVRMDDKNHKEEGL